MILKVGNQESQIGDLKNPDRAHHGFLVMSVKTELFSLLFHSSNARLSKRD